MSAPVTPASRPRAFCGLCQGSGSLTMLASGSTWRRDCPSCVDEGSQWVKLAGSPRRILTVLADRWPDQDTWVDIGFMAALVFGGMVLGFVLGLGL